MRLNKVNNRDVGLIILGVTSLIVLLAWSYDATLYDIINTSCTHGYSCPMYQALGAQRGVSTVLIIILVSVSVYLILFEKIKIRFMLKKIKLAVSGDEKRIYEYLIKNNNEVLQSKLKKEFNISKVRMTRILNRLEKKGLIERKRKGLQNLVILKMKLVSQ